MKKIAIFFLGMMVLNGCSQQDYSDETKYKTIYYQVKKVENGVVLAHTISNNSKEVGGILGTKFNNGLHLKEGEIFEEIYDVKTFSNVEKRTVIKKQKTKKTLSEIKKLYKENNG